MAVNKKKIREKVKELLPFKRGNDYKNLDQALQNTGVSVHQAYRMADARVKANEAIEKVKKMIKKGR